MNNVTISDLSEKSTLEDTDLFLVRDSNEADMKIKGKVFADKITDSLSGYTKDNDTLSTLNTASKKPVNSSAVNSALANLKSLNIDTTKTDANLCYNVNAKVSFYRLPTTATNIPKTNGLFFIQSNGYYLDGVIRINQIATSNGNDNDNTIYTRKGYNSGNEIIWTSWTKLTTETDLNTTLANYVVINIEKLKDSTFTSEEITLFNKLTNVKNFACYGIYGTKELNYCKRNNATMFVNGGDSTSYSNFFILDTTTQLKYDLRIGLSFKL